MKKIVSLGMLILMVACAPLVFPGSKPETTPDESGNNTVPLVPSETSSTTPTQEPATSTIEATPTPTLTTTPTPTTVFCLHLLRPDSGSRLPASGQVAFEWESQAGAQYYVLTLGLPNGFRETSQTEAAQVTRFVNLPASPGPYEWMVTAYDAQGRRICDSGIFTLFYATTGANGTIPTAIAPPTVLFTQTNTFIAPPTGVFTQTSTFIAPPPMSFTATAIVPPTSSFTVTAFTNPTQVATATFIVPPTSTNVAFTPVSPTAFP